MILTEVKNKHHKYYVDQHGFYQGRYERYLNDGSITVEHYVNGRRHGEYKSFYNNGNLRSMGTYKNNLFSLEYKALTSYGTVIIHQYYHRGEIVHDLLEYPLNEVGMMMLRLKYGD